MNHRYSLTSVWLVGVLLVLSLGGCAGQQTNIRSSVMEYLYPKSEDTYETPSIPHLNLPLRVGVAFVPDSRRSDSSYNFWAGQSTLNTITEAKKAEILEGVADQFRTLEFIKSIEVIPSAYLTPGGSFTNLSQIQTMYGIDVIALVSYDQVQFTDAGVLSLSYWTIVGAYVVSGEKNDTSTLLDTVVYDISSRKMLFRAPGTSKVEGRATPVNLSEELRADSIAGFEKAADNMTRNLQSQLEAFKEKIKEDPANVKISHRPGYSGGGSVGLVVLLSLLLMASVRRFNVRR